MDRNEIALNARYFKKQPVTRAFVFGSQARHDDSKESDIDLLIELDHSRPIGLLFITMKLELERILKRKVDLLTKDSISKYIRPQIEAEKQLIYEK